MVFIGLIGCRRMNLSVFAAAPSPPDLMNSDGPDVDPAVRVWFMNVGNAHCTIVLDESTKKAIIVDCPSSHVANVMDLLAQRQGTIDTCIVTHWDVDHYAGVARLAITSPVSRVMYNHDTLFVSDDSPPFAVRGALKEFLNIPNASMVLAPVTAGSRGRFGRVSWKVLAPNHQELTMAYVSRRRNVASAVVEVSAPGMRILIGGDAVGSTWVRVLGEYSVEADVLRWPHHGADMEGDPSGAIRDSVMAAVAPSCVVISAGSGNTYGHPSHDVVKRLARSSRVMCTQVTAGCFGYKLRLERNSHEARDLVAGLASTYCADTVYVECFESSYRMSPSVSEHAARVATW